PGHLRAVTCLLPELLALPEARLRRSAIAQASLHVPHVPECLCRRRRVAQLFAALQSLALVNESARPILQLRVKNADVVETIGGGRHVAPALEARLRLLERVERARRLAQFRVDDAPVPQRPGRLSELLDLLIEPGAPPVAIERRDVLRLIVVDAGAHSQRG